MIELEDDINHMLNDIMVKFELETGKTTSEISMISGLIRDKHYRMKL